MPGAQPANKVRPSQASFTVPRCSTRRSLPAGISRGSCVTFSREPSSTSSPSTPSRSGRACSVNEHVGSSRETVTVKYVVTRPISVPTRPLTNARSSSRNVVSDPVCVSSLRQREPISKAHHLLPNSGPSSQPRSLYRAFDEQAKAPCPHGRSEAACQGLVENDQPPQTPQHEHRIRQAGQILRILEVEAGDRSAATMKIERLPLTYRQLPFDSRPIASLAPTAPGSNWSARRYSRNAPAVSPRFSSARPSSS